MDFIDRIKEVSKRIEKSKDQVKTEEACKTAFVLPFISALGYDVFNPSEVVPEFIAEPGIKKGEKIDYAIFKDNEPIILIECKCCGENLETKWDQLYRYFNAINARFGILTDGIIYQFYTDLESSNKLDEKPFLTFNLLDLKENLIPELKKFCKESFDLDNILSTAGELKYTKEIKNVINAEYNDPSEEFVRFFASRILDKRLTANVIEKCKPLTQKAFAQFINDKINERLQSAIYQESTTPEKKEPVEEVLPEGEVSEAEKPEITTTIEELTGFAIVKSLLREVIELERVTFKDTLRYFGINIDNTPQKTICRLYLNTGNKYISFIDRDRHEEKFQIESIDDIYNFKDKLIEAVHLKTEELVKK